MSGNFILGVGTGRCGSNTLTELLKINGISAIHEGHPKPEWDGSSDIDPYSLGPCRVAHWWLNYIPKIFGARETRVICLKRDKQTTVESYCAIKGIDLEPAHQLNHFRPSGTALVDVDRTYPTYYKAADGCATSDEITLKDGFDKFWDEYYSTIDNYIEQGYPIKIFKTETLGSVETQGAILEYAGLRGPYKLFPGLRLWTREAFTEKLQRATCERAYTR